jgi:hypothetical protein
MKQYKCFKKNKKEAHLILLNAMEHWIWYISIILEYIEAWVTGDSFQMYLLKKTSFLREILGSQQNWWIYAKTSHILPGPNTSTARPIVNTPPH